MLMSAEGKFTSTSDQSAVSLSDISPWTEQACKTSALMIMIMISLSCYVTSIYHMYVYLFMYLSTVRTHKIVAGQTRINFIIRGKYS